MDRRAFVRDVLAGVGGLSSLAVRVRRTLTARTDMPYEKSGSPSAEVSTEPKPGRLLFPTGLPELEWQEFQAAGFSRPVSGIIFRADQPPCCGVPLGGISTGCLDIQATGVLGFSTLFSRFAITPQLLIPFLGLAVAGKTYVFSSRRLLEGGRFQSCTAPGADPSYWIVDIPKIRDVEAPKEIYYWGHYPVADMEFETDGPVNVGMRAWSPFIPGDTSSSNIPAIVFEIHLRSTATLSLPATLGFSFPGPDTTEAHSYQFTRVPIEGGGMQGVEVTSSGNKVEYVAAVVGTERVRVGTRLDQNSLGWSRIRTELPQPIPYRGRPGTFVDGSCSLGVDLSIEPGEIKTIRILLAWFAPYWKGEGAHPVLPHPAVPSSVIVRAGEESYREMYSTRFDSARSVAKEIVGNHESLLRRVLAWQEAIYVDASLPPWLRDSLINNLALIPEDSFWAAPNGSDESWFGSGGLFGLCESVRSCPQIECIPCSWYGNLPIVYFFPELATSTLCGYRHYMRDDGAVPFIFGPGVHMNGEAITYDWQISLNGTCYVDLVDRVWRRTGDDELLKEFYGSVKKCNTLTMNLCSGPAGVISAPKGLHGEGVEWFEHGDWAGMCTHLGGLHLAQLRMMERMAHHLGDHEYVRQCETWLADGQLAMEEEMWAGSYYLNFYEKQTGRKSDEVMAYQLDGQWAALFHGLPGVFRSDRVDMALETIKRCNVALTPDVGAANFARPNGSSLPAKSRVAYYGVYSMFTAEVLVLAMTYLYAGHKEFGIELARRHWDTVVRRQRRPWDLPNMVMGQKGLKRSGTEYYQAMMLWALPAALKDQSLRDPLAPGGLIARVIEAAREGHLHAQSTQQD
jgi:uncharacterized protein (DUF608 family)